MKIEAHRKILLAAILTLLFIPLLTNPAHGDDSISEFKLTAGIYAAEFDQFGYSVDISGNTAVVGAPFADSAYVFQYDESKSAWSEDPVVELTAPVPAGPGQFGWSVAIHGDTVVVGALDLRSYIGSAYVFTRSGGTWDQGHQLIAGAGIGASVAISGDTLVVGALIPATSAYVFRYVYDDSMGTWDWIQKEELKAPGASFAPFFGWSVAIDGDTVVVGAPFAGAAYVYARSDDTWDEGSELITGVWVGSSVAVSGDTVVVAAPSYTSFPLHPPSGPGSVSLFSRSGGTWTSAGILNSQASGFGASVGISGNTLVVGAPQDNNDGKLSGSAYMFKYDGTNWVADPSLPKLSPSVAPPADDSDQFGRDVAIDASTVVAGAIFGDGPVVDSGSASVFILASPNQPPIAEAEAFPNEIKEGDLVTLDGSESQDPDGDPLIYNWMQTGGPEVDLNLDSALVLAANDKKNPAVRTFVAPELSDGCDTLTFQLTVTEDVEGGLTSEPVTVEIRVLPNNTIHSKLERKHRHWLYWHKYTFEGVKDQVVTLNLQADPDGLSGGERATLILKDKIRRVRLYKKDRGALPNTVTATLPADGKYVVYVVKQPWFCRGKNFRGDYILTLEGTCGKLKRTSRFWHR